MEEVSVHVLREKEPFSLAFTDDELRFTAEKYGTPIYLIDEKTLIEKVRELQEAYKAFLGNVRIAYSIKSNFNPFLLQTFMRLNLLFDIASLGELYFINRLNGNPENLIYTSVTETFEEFLYAIDKGLRRFVVASYHGVNNLIRASEVTNTKLKAMIRINPQVNVKAYVRASFRHGKFGVPFNSSTRDSTLVILREIIKSKNLIFEGFHFHLGSQITDTSSFIATLDKIENFMIKARKEFPNLCINTLDIGGGTPVCYDEPVPTAEEMAKPIVNKLNMLSNYYSERPSLIIESGRFLAAESGIMLSKVLNVKEFEGEKYLYLDSGYHLLLDSVLVRQNYPVRVIGKRGREGNGSKIHLAGIFCDSSDVFHFSPLSEINGADVGDYIAFYKVGAYSIVFNLPFHCQVKPPILFKDKDGNLKLARKKESIEDLFEEEGGYLALRDET
ncbi:MAG: hypothetical protein QXX95_07830 [Nitrososphaerales archaeon]